LWQTLRPLPKSENYNKTLEEPIGEITCFMGLYNIGSTFDIYTCKCIFGLIGFSLPKSKVISNVIVEPIFLKTSIMHKDIDVKASWRTGMFCMPNVACTAALLDVVHANFECT